VLRKILNDFRSLANHVPYDWHLQSVEDLQHFLRVRYRPAEDFDSIH
jgi:hypothetical protein